nr:hypothetical protein [Pedobacter panaciterrae]
MQSLVKKPVYSNNNPAPVKLPNAYIKSADHSVPIPTHRVLVDSIRFTPKQ